MVKNIKFKIIQKITFPQSYKRINYYLQRLINLLTQKVELNMKDFFVKNWIHFAIIAFFFTLTFVYFSPQFDGFGLKQHDIEQFSGMAHETQSFREETGKEPLWTNSMFGGMPTAQISVVYSGNIFQQTTLGFVRLFGGPAAIVFLHLIGFYLLSLCLRLNPIVGVIGAIAVAFSSYEIIILQAGHNSKAISVALMAPTIGAFLMAYRRNWKWGAILSALFMSYQLASNHLQVTYYMAILLVGLGIYEFITAVKSKKIKQFFITTSCLIGAYLLAAMINYGNISMTNDYAKHTIRGANDVTINPDGTKSNVQSTGLDKDYITNWSYGVGESFTLLSPYVKGSSTVALGNSPFADYTDKTDLTGDEIKATQDMAVYWGDQPMTSGPVFIGIIVIFLSLLGLIYLKDRSKWVLLSVSVLCLMLSWGKNFMGLTDFFIDNVPGYNKFRTVTIILVIVEFCLPLLAVLFLDQLLKERESIKLNKKPFLIASGGLFIFLVGMKLIGIGDHYTSNSDKDQLERYRSGIESQINGMDPAVLASQYKLDVTNKDQVSQFVDAQMEGVNKGFDGIKVVRKEIFNSSLNTSILILIFAFGLIALLFYTATSTIIVYFGLAILLMIELIPVDQNYLSSETLDNGDFKYWTEKSKILYPVSSEAEDDQIIQIETAENKMVNSAVLKGEKAGLLKASELEYTGDDKRRVVDSYRFNALNNATNYRVFDFSGGFGSARTSYFHKSLGGYHGAKLRNIQNVYDFHLSRSNNKVYDMMNVKYFIQEGQLRPNPTALGNAWLVKSVNTVETPNDEIVALGNEFKVVNSGKGQLLINGSPLKEGNVFGNEKIQYLNNGIDSLTVSLPNGLKKGMKALFVIDATGKTNLIPEQTQMMDTANSFTSLATIEIVSEFNPANDAVMLKSEADQLSTLKYSGEGSVKMTAYAPNKLNYTAKVNTKQLIVFSEVYYADGWKAFVDGKEVEIRKVDYLLRGIEVEKGQHSIEFKFDLPKYHQSNTYAILGSGIIFLLIVGGFWMDRKKEKEGVV